MISIPLSFYAAADRPPSYRSSGFAGMKTQVKEAKQSSSNKGSFAVKFCDIVCGSGMYTNNTCIYTCMRARTCIHLYTMECHKFTNYDIHIIICMLEPHNYVCTDVFKLGVCMYIYIR